MDVIFLKLGNLFSSIETNFDGTVVVSERNTFQLSAFYLARKKTLAEKETWKAFSCLIFISYLGTIFSLHQSNENTYMHRNTIFSTKEKLENVFQCTSAMSAGIVYVHAHRHHCHQSTLNVHISKPISKI